MPDGPGTFTFGRGERKRRRRGRKGPGPFSSSPPPLHTPPAFPHPPTDPTSSWASPCGKSSENPVFPIISQYKPHPRLPSLAPKKRGCCGMPPRRRAPFRGCDFQPHPVQEAARGLPPPWAMRLPAASPQPRFSPPLFSPANRIRNNYMYNSSQTSCIHGKPMQQSMPNRRNQP